MNLLVMNLPEPAQLPGWLEQHLVGLELGRLAAELSAGQPPSADAPSVRDLLGARLAEVLGGGLGLLPEEMLRSLLLYPTCLLELQELVLAEGGVYWGRVCASPPDDPLSIAPGAWGWNEKALEAESTRPAYLNRLADGANGWFVNQPEEAPLLAKRLGQLRQGCTHIIFAEHAPLPPAERDWLRERCRHWGRQLDGSLAALEGGREPAAVRAEVDALVQGIVEALRARAEGAG